MQRIRSAACLILALLLASVSVSSQQLIDRQRSIDEVQKAIDAIKALPVFTLPPPVKESCNADGTPNGVDEDQDGAVDENCKALPPPPPACTFTLSGATASLPANASTNTVNLTAAPSGCAPSDWTASSAASWLSVAAQGSGTAVVAYTATANDGAVRTGVLTIAGQTLTVSQAAAPVTEPPSLVLPTGIPAPSFGLTETVQSVHGSATIATHVVDNSRPCSDTNNPLGTQTNPRCAFPVMTALPAGSVVQVRGGPYTLSANLAIAGTGTATSPIFVTTQGVAAVTLNLGGSRAVQMGGAYTIFEGFALVNQDEAVQIGGNHNVFRRNKVTGTGTTADGNGSMISTGSSSHSVVAWNDVSDGGAYQSTTENDMHCLGVGSNQNNTWWLWNKVDRCAGDGIGNGHDANHTSSRLFIGGNQFASARENCVDLKEVHDVVISENICSDIKSSSSSPGEGFVLHYGPTSGQGPYNDWTINNTCRDVVKCIAFSAAGAGPHYVIGNLMERCSDVGIEFNASSSPSADFFIYHNTAVQCGRGLLVGSGFRSMTVGGNLITGATQALRVDTTTLAAALAISRELYPSPVAIAWGKTSTSYTSVSSWISGTGKGAGSLQADPLFVSQSTGDYALQAGSPAIGAGVDMSAIAATFANAFGASLLRDRVGVRRPAGVWDIGAHQR